MAPPMKRASKPAAAKPAPEAEADENVITSVTVSRGFKLGGSDYSSAQCFVSVAASTYDLASATVDECLALEIEKLGAQADNLGIDLRGGSESGLDDDAEGEGAEEDAEGEGEEEEAALGPDDIAKMTRKDIEALISENGLETDPSDYKSTKAGLEDLRAAVIAEAFGEGEEAEDGDDDTGEEAEDDTGEEEAEIDEDTINAMERPELVKFIKDNEIDIDPKKHPKLAALRAAVIEVLSEASEEEAEEDGEEEAAAEGYDEATLKAMPIADLKALFADWEIGKFPPGPDKVAKGVAIKKILAFQSEAE